MSTKRSRAHAPVEEQSSAEFATHLSHSVLRMARLLRQLSHDQVSATQSTALMIIDRYGPLPISELATIENIARPTASSLVAKLEQAGLVRRLDDPADARVCRIELTRQGRSVVRKARSRRTSWLSVRLEACTPEELAALRVASKVLDEITIGPDRPWDSPLRSAESLTTPD
jgi:DNA-binding MarR family transcriptional regulator